MSITAKIGIGWAVIAVAGLYSFKLSKDSVHERRYQSMKIKERMRKAVSE